MKIRVLLAALLVLAGLAQAAPVTAAPGDPVLDPMPDLGRAVKIPADGTPVEVVRVIPSEPFQSFSLQGLVSGSFEFAGVTDPGGLPCGANGGAGNFYLSVISQTCIVQVRAASPLAPGDLATGVLSIAAFRGEGADLQMLASADYALFAVNPHPNDALADAVDLGAAFDAAGPPWAWANRLIVHGSTEGATGEVGEYDDAADGNGNPAPTSPGSVWYKIAPSRFAGALEARAVGLDGQNRFKVRVLQSSDPNPGVDGLRLSAASIDRPWIEPGKRVWIQVTRDPSFPPDPDYPYPPDLFSLQVRQAAPEWEDQTRAFDASFQVPFGQPYGASDPGEPRTAAVPGDTFGEWTAGMTEPPGRDTWFAAPFDIPSGATGTLRFLVGSLAATGEPGMRPLGYEIYRAGTDGATTLVRSGSTSASSEVWSWTRPTSQSEQQVADVTVPVDGAGRYLLKVSPGSMGPSFVFAGFTFVLITGGTGGTPPETTITQSPDSPTKAADLTFSFASDVQAATFECSTSVPSSFTPCTSPHTVANVQEGLLTFRVRATSAGGTDPTPASTSVVIDRTPPETTITGYTVRRISGPWFYVTFEFASSEANSTFLCGGSGMTASTPCTSPHVIYADTNAWPRDGLARFWVVATDQAGNRDGTAAEAAVYLDSQNPVATITSPIDGSFMERVQAPALTYSCSDNIGVTAEQVVVDDQPFVDGAQLPTAPGPHTVVLSCFDAVGNMGSAQAIYTIIGHPECTITGTSAGDRLVGTSRDDVICGLGGNDILIGGGGDDTLIGGDGADALYGGLLLGLLPTGIGNHGKDTLVGGAGNDWLDGGADDDALYGGTGDDQLWGQGGYDILRGEGGNDTLRGGNERDLLYGLSGDDFLYGGAGADEIYAGDGADRVWGDDGNDFIDTWGDRMDDRWVSGGAGNDRADVDRNDRLDGSIEDVRIWS